MSNTMVSIIPGQNFSGYLATPKAGMGPGIVMIQEIFGVNQSMRTIADRFAADGYTVLAPDIFWRLKPNVQLGYEGKDLEQAFEFYHEFDVDQGVRDLIAAVDFLRNHPNCNGKVATLGFCLGGKLAYLTAARHNIDAAVAFYGGGIVEHLDEADKIHCPILMHFGEKDEMIPPDQVDEIKETFKGREDVEIDVYPGVGHAFFNHCRKSYDPKAAALAEKRSLAFLKGALG